VIAAAAVATYLVVILVLLRALQELAVEQRAEDEPERRAAGKDRP
jgi:hypothetical protein